MNVTDFIIVFLLLLAAFDGWRTGFLALLIDLIAFIAGIVLAYLFAVPVGAFVGGWFSLSVGLQPLFGFALVFLAAAGIVRLIAHPLRKQLVANAPIASRVNAWVGVTLNLAKQWVALMIALNLLLFLPVIRFVRKDIQRSRLAPYFVVERGFIGQATAKVIEAAVFELQGFITTKTISDEHETLSAPIGSLTNDTAAEQEMLVLVNSERISRGLKTLAGNEQLANVARLHSRDMWRRQYFAHINPDGADPFARLHQAGVLYLVAGENLALAPNTTIAHKGLMNSPEHKDNILSPDYGQIGIGVIRNGLYGATYTQLFMN